MCFFFYISLYFQQRIWLYIEFVIIGFMKKQTSLSQALRLNKGKTLKIKLKVIVAQLYQSDPLMMNLVRSIYFLDKETKCYF